MLHSSGNHRVNLFGSYRCSKGTLSLQKLFKLSFHGLLPWREKTGTRNSCKWTKIHININAEMCILFPKRYIILERPHYSSERGKVLNPSSWIEATEGLAMTLWQAALDHCQLVPPNKKEIVSCSLSYWHRGKSTNMLTERCSKRVNVTVIRPSRTQDIQ